MAGGYAIAAKLARSWIHKVQRRVLARLTLDIKLLLLLAQLRQRLAGRAVHFDGGIFLTGPAIKKIAIGIAYFDVGAVTVITEQPLRKTSMWIWQW